MHVLQLVTNERAPFFRQQVDSLERLGVTCDVRSPAGARSSTNSRSLGAYLSMAAEALMVRAGRSDLLHANYGLTAPAALLARETPTVLSLWGSDLLGSTGPFSRFCARQVDEVIVMNREMASRLERPTHVIPHGIDMDRFRPIARERSLAEVGWQDGRKHVLFPYSADRAIKDFSTAASAVGALRKRLEDPVQLHTLTGVDHDRMPYYYNAADAVLISSKREGSPNAVREALACNRPVVATDVGDIREHLDGLPVSTVCRSQSELTRGLVTALTTERSPAGRPRVRKTSAEAMGERLVTVYDRALGGVSGTEPQRNAATAEVG